MTPPSLTASPTPKRNRRRWGWVVLIVILAAFGVLGWRNFTYERAVRQLEEAGITVAGRNKPGLADKLRAVRSDWRYWPILFQSSAPDEAIERWKINDAKRSELRNLDTVANALRRVNPKSLDLYECSALQNVDGLKGLTKLDSLSLARCDGLQNLDGLKGLTTLRILRVGGSDRHKYPRQGLVTWKDVDALKGLTNLKDLELECWHDLQDLDGLKGLTKLIRLEVSHATHLKKLDALGALTALDHLDLHWCSDLTNVDVLKGLKQLNSLYLADCLKLPSEAITALKVALRHADFNGGVNYSFPGPL